MVKEGIKNEEQRKERYMNKIGEKDIGKEERKA